MLTNVGRIQGHKMSEITFSKDERRTVRKNRHDSFLKQVSDICREHGGRVNTRDNNYSVVDLAKYEVIER